MKKMLQQNTESEQAGSHYYLLNFLFSCLVSYSKVIFLDSNNLLSEKGIYSTFF